LESWWIASNSLFLGLGLGLLSSKFTSGNITTAKAFNRLKVFENSTVWRPLQEDQDRSIPPSFDLEKRKGRRNAFPKAPSVQQEKYPQVSPGYPSVAYEALVG
jgi:hypothetical protein